jgi:hypothetical protein
MGMEAEHVHGSYVLDGDIEGSLLGTRRQPLAGSALRK